MIMTDSINIFNMKRKKKKVICVTIVSQIKNLKLYPGWFFFGKPQLKITF